MTTFMRWSSLGLGRRTSTARWPLHGMASSSAHSSVAVPEPQTPRQDARARTNPRFELQLAARLAVRRPNVWQLATAAHASALAAREVRGATVRRSHADDAVACQRFAAHEDGNTGHGLQHCRALDHAFSSLLAAHAEAMLRSIVEHMNADVLVGTGTNASRERGPPLRIAIGDAVTSGRLVGRAAVLAC